MTVDRSRSDYCLFTENCHRITASNRYFQPNRKWKYGVNLIFELRAIDILFDPNTMYASIGHRLGAKTISGFDEAGSFEI